MTLGFVVGKFYPPHRGHKYLIETARKQVDHLIVMLAAHPSQTIPGELRLSWLQELHPDCDVQLVADELEDDSQQWAEFTVNYLGRAPDVVFSSEDYGPRYAQLMGSQHVMVDRERQIVRISGTEIRARPFDYWDYLEPCVRAYFAKRVVIVGAESTGKTTLAEMLAKRFDTNWVPEYGREHWAKKVAGLSMNDVLPGWTVEEFRHIAETQQAREAAAVRETNRALICDTNAFATGTWFERYMGKRDAQVDAIGARDKVDLYLLCAPDVAFVQDGFRDGEQIRDWMHTRFREQLAACDTPYIEIRGDYEIRWRIAENALAELLSSGGGVKGAS
jgi:HTH-type transcriptional regulator, transcriptional repressor of NAD biosynthesis genes